MICIHQDAFPKSQGFTQKLGDSSLIVRFTGRDNVSISNGHVWKRQRKVSFVFQTEFYPLYDAPFTELTFLVHEPSLPSINTYQDIR